MVCKNARNGPQNERKNPQTSANLKKCSFEHINLGHFFIARAEIEDSGTNCVFEQKKSEQKKRYQWKVQVRSQCPQGSNYHIPLKLGQYKHNIDKQKLVVVFLGGEGGGGGEFCRRR